MKRASWPPSERSWPLLPLLLLLLIGASAALIASGDERGSISSGHAELTSADGTQESSQPPAGELKLIGFEAFKRRFGKHYKSALEQAFRLRQFLASLARVGRSMLAYLHARASYFLRINRRSDLTPAERRALFGVPLDAETRAELAAAAAAAESPPPPPVRKKRGLLGAIGRQLRAHRGKSKGARLSEQLSYDIDWRQGGQGAAAAAPKCLNEPHLDQGECGCCYAMAVVRRFEWLHCKQAAGGAPVKLSEQYLVDCGRPFQLAGCASGNALGALKFVEAAGLLPARLLPYAGEERECRLDATARSHLIKPTRVTHSLFKSQTQWAEALRARGPLVVYARLSEDFFDYAGGLYEARKCDPELGHFMLLAGLGRDAAGRAFWLLSNSFGRDYGESGYIRVPAPAGAGAPGAANCLLYAMAAEADFPARDHIS